MLAVVDADVALDVGHVGVDRRERDTQLDVGDVKRCNDCNERKASYFKSFYDDLVRKLLNVPTRPLVKRPF